MPKSWLSRFQEEPSQEKVEMIKMSSQNLTHYSVNDNSVNDVEHQSEEKKGQGFLDGLLNSTPSSTKNSQPVTIESHRKSTAFGHKKFGTLEDIGEESQSQNSSLYYSDKVAEASGYLSCNGSILAELKDSQKNELPL